MSSLPIRAFVKEMHWPTCYYPGPREGYLRSRIQTSGTILTRSIQLLACTDDVDTAKEVTSNAMKRWHQECLAKDNLAP